MYYYMILIAVFNFYIFQSSKGDITDLTVSSKNDLVASGSNDFTIRVVSYFLLYLLSIISIVN